MLSFLFLLLFIIGVSSFRLPIPSFALQNLRKKSLIECGTSTVLPPPITLFDLPNSASSDVVAYLQWWGSNQVQGDPLVLAENTPTGVKFRLDKMDIPILDVFAKEEAGGTKIQVLNNGEDWAQVEMVYPEYMPLMGKIMTNYIDSLHQQLGSQFLAQSVKDNLDPENSKRMDKQDSLELLRAHSEKHKDDKSYMDRLKLSAPPDLPDINSLWRREPLTAEDEEILEKCMAGEMPKQPMEYDLDQLIENAEDPEQRIEKPLEVVESANDASDSTGIANSGQHNPSPLPSSSEEVQLASPLVSQPPVAEPTGQQQQGSESTPQTQHAPASAPQDLRRELQRWSTANPTVVAAVIRLWAKKFTAKGLGMQAVDTASGAIISFDAMDARRELAVHLSVSKNTEGAVWVTSQLEEVSGTEKNKVIEPKQEGDTVAHAVARLENSLVEEFRQMILTGEDIPFVEPTRAGEVDTSKVSKSAFPVDSRAAIEEALAMAHGANKHLRWTDIEERATAHSGLEGAEKEPEVKIPRRRDPVLMQKAAKAGVRLEKFENRGLEESAMKELKDLLGKGRSEGFVKVIQSYGKNASTAIEMAPPRSAYAVATGVDERSKSNLNQDDTEKKEDPLVELFKAGERMSSLSLADIMNRPSNGETIDQLRGPTPTMPVSLPDSLISTGEGLDIFQSPAELQATITGTPAPYRTPLHPTSVAGMKEMEENFDPNRPPDVTNYDLDNMRLNALMNTLNHTLPEMQDLVIDGYRDLLLSENIMFLLRRAQQNVESMEERLLYKKITEKTASLVTEISILFKTESLRHLETIQEVCRITAEFKDNDEHYLDNIETMKPYFDQDFLSYLTYAIGEEMGKMRAKGVDPTLAPSSWLRVLTIIRNGVEAEFETRFSYLIESIQLVVRWDRPGDEEVRSALFKACVASTPAMELPHFKQLAVNMVEHVMARHAQETGLSPAQPLFAAGPTEHPMEPRELRRLVRQMKSLKEDIDLHLSDAYMREKMVEWQKEVEEQGMTIHARHRNRVRQDALETARALHQRAMQQIGDGPPKILTDGSEREARGSGG